MLLCSAICTRNGRNAADRWLSTAVRILLSSRDPEALRTIRLCLQALSIMQTPERYWEGLFWDGMNPEKLGA